MRRLNRHLSWRDLNRLADEELDVGARGPAMEHVAACRKCSRRMSFLGDLRDAGREMRHPAPPRELLDDVLRNRSEGRRVILPVVGTAPAPRRRALPAVAAVALMAGLAFLVPLFLAPEAGAGASELTVDPPNPVPGDEIRLSYRPATELAGEPELRLRLRLRGADSEPPRETLGEHAAVILRPDAGGKYTGSLRLPPDFAYAAMAVESSTGDRVDDRGGRLWGLRAHAGGGNPSLSALRQEFLVLQHRSWPEAREALHDMTILYPERAEGWSQQLLFELPALLPDGAGSTRARHREMFHGFESSFDPLETSADEIAAMARYAITLNDSEAEWIGRLAALDPVHRLVVSASVVEIGADSKRADEYLERLWSVDGGRTSAVYRMGFRTAERAGDMETARRWALRGLDMDVGDDHDLIRDMALVLVADPETRERGISAIRALLGHVSAATEEERPLDRTPEEVRDRSRRLETILRVELAAQLVASGQPSAALDELEVADSLGEWSPDLYRTRLEARLLVGDAQSALADFHRLDVDPIYSRESIDSLRHRLPALSTVDLSAGRERAEHEMVERVLADGYRRGLPPIDLLTSTGQSRTLESLVGGRPTALIVWDRRLADSDEDASEVIQARRLLAGGAGQLLWITPEPDSEPLQAFTHVLGMSAYHDPGSELATSLGEWGSRGYFVIDEAGFIRARTDSLMEAVRHLEVLLGSRDTA